MAIHDDIVELLAVCSVDDPQYATRVVDGLLQATASAGASDLHLQPTEEGLQIKWRIDGVMQLLGVVPKQVSNNIVVRIKVLSKLLTYESQLPQEGRIPQQNHQQDIRVSTFPTIFGEKVVARFMQTGDASLARIADLNFPSHVANTIIATLNQTSGVLLIVGPAGSGKTTTAYACLREILAQSKMERNITSVEDPVEQVISDVSQSEVSEAVGFDLTSGLRSLVRQDPDVIFVGEIRDPATASIAFQAALTGQLVISTFHASDSSTAISRLTNMGVPPYVLRSAIRTIVAQQLVRRLCKCSIATNKADDDSNSRLGLQVDKWDLPKGCANCLQTGYYGRQLVAESLELDSHEIFSAIKKNVDAKLLRSLAIKSGMKPLYGYSLELVSRGITSPAEVVRVLGHLNSPD